MAKSHCYCIAYIPFGKKKIQLEWIHDKLDSDL